MTDLIEWLRQEAELAEYEGCDVSAANYKKAADEIERLNAEVTHYAQAYHREMVANKKLQAVVDAAEAFMAKRYDGNEEILEDALAALKEADK